MRCDIHSELYTGMQTIIIHWYILDSVNINVIRRICLEKTQYIPCFARNNFCSKNNENDTFQTHQSWNLK